MKRLNLRVVESMAIPGMLSMRLRKKIPAGRTGGTDLRRAIATAGFKAGDLVVLVNAADLAALTRKRNRKPASHPLDAPGEGGTL